jgi:hypothetical protein
LFHFAGYTVLSEIDFEEQMVTLMEQQRGKSCCKRNKDLRMKMTYSTDAGLTSSIQAKQKTPLFSSYCSSSCADALISLSKQTGAALIERLQLAINANAFLFEPILAAKFL